MIEKYKEQLYNDYFEKAYRFLKQGLLGDFKKDISLLESTIDILYTHQGNDWIGRGDIGLIKTNASIAAAEVLKEEIIAQFSQKKDNV